MSFEDWKSVSWGEIASLEYGKSLKDYKSSKGRVPVFGTNGPIGFTDKPLYNQPSVIVGRKGAYRGIHFSNQPFFVIDTAFYLKPKIKDLDIKYAYYQLLTQDINAMDSGSAIPSTRREDFYNLGLFLPPLSIQQKISSILSALDDKIELNRQTNQTLEAIAQALFKEWFVDFNFPGATGEMQKSELGEIPKGWKVVPLDQVAEFLNGLALQKFPSKEGDEFLPVIKIRELKNGITANTDKANKNVPEKYIINDGDLLFSWSGTLEVRFWVGGKGALNQHLFKVSSGKYPIWFCYVWTLHHLSEFRRIAEDKATTMGHIQRRHLSEATCLIPVTLETMNGCMTPLIEQYINNEQQIHTLINLRDNLLPKLMKGEIDF